MRPGSLRWLFPLLSLGVLAGPTVAADGALKDVQSRQASRNSARGASALASVTTGQFDSALGWDALHDNTSGSYNTAFGAAVLSENKVGSYNTGIGAVALNHNTGRDNTAVGYSALADNLDGSLNTAVGKNALGSNNTGNANTALGYNSLFLSSGSNNTAVGYYALYENLEGSNNIALGFEAGRNVTGSGNIHIGNAGLEADSGTIRIGTDGAQTATYIAGINATPITGSAVYISASGQLGVHHDEITPMLLHELQRQNQTIAAQGDVIASQERRLRVMRQQLSDMKAAVRELRHNLTLQQTALQSTTPYAVPH